MTQNSFSEQFYEQRAVDRSRAGLLESDYLQIRPAKPGDIDNVLGILNRATNWLLDNNFPTPWVPGRFSRPTFQEQILKGEVYLAAANTVPVGTFVLQWSDPTFWGERPPDAGYLHKFAVEPEHYSKESDKQCYDGRWRERDKLARSISGSTASPKTGESETTMRRPDSNIEETLSARFV